MNYRTEKDTMGAVTQREVLFISSKHVERKSHSI